jgi:inhibitor of cysteine peptidase
VIPAALCAANQAAAVETITVVPGDVFSIRLTSNPSTGFQWALAKPLDENVVSLVDHNYIPPTKQILGAGGEEVWRFKAVGSGEAVIELHYARSWEKDVPPAKVAVYRVVVGSHVKDVSISFISSRLSTRSHPMFSHSCFSQSRNQLVKHGSKNYVAMPTMPAWTFPLRVRWANERTPVGCAYGGCGHPSRSE